MIVGAPQVQNVGLLGDRRRFARLQQLVTTLTARAQASLPQAFADVAGLRGAYRFFASRAVTPAAILATARPDCLAKIAQERRVLLVQDTTSLDFTRHAATTGLGPIGTRRQKTQGILVHSCLAVSDAGTPLGLAGQHVWLRDPTTAGSSAARRTRPLAEKESARWLAVEAASREGMPPEVETITVADAEADIFALFAAPRPPQAHLLIRAAQSQRCLEDGQTLAAAAALAPVWGHYTLRLAARGTQPERTAHCVLRVGAVTLRPPRNQRAGAALQTPVPLTALWVAEEGAPEGSTPLHWLLLTTLPVASFVAAATVVGYYSLRWLIEQYHFVLKTGCQAERLQLQQAERLERAVAVCCLVAVQVLWLTFLQREQPEAPCTRAFREAEWQALCCATTHTAPPPTTPPSLREAVRAVAKLGGFLGRNSDGEPGPLTIWRGLSRLRDRTTMWELLHPTPAVTQCEKR